MHALFRGISVIPVLTIDRERDAVPLARALFDGGLTVIEVTLAHAGGIRGDRRDRSRVAAGCGRRRHLAACRPTSPTRCMPARVFWSAPATTPELAASALADRTALSAGRRDPVRGHGGARARGLLHEILPSRGARRRGDFCGRLAPVFPGVAFCPTGGIDERLAADYLALPNVPIVGGSWMAPKDAIQAGDWGRIRRLAERAASVGRQQAA